MEKWLYIVTSNLIDPASEEKYKEWFEKIHLPDILETSDFAHGAIYKSKDPIDGHSQYLTVLEIETDDIDGTMAKHRNNMQKKAELGRIPKLSNVVSRQLYKKFIELER
jgi:hypothetical protein